MRLLSLVSALVLGAAATAVAAPSVTATSTTTAGGLVLDGEGSSSTHVVKIADLALFTDGGGGFTVFVTSGDLTKGDGRTSIPFQVLVVDDGAAAPLPSEFTTPSGSTSSWSSLGPGAAEKDLYIKYTPASLQDPGAYSAGVGLEIIDN